MKPIIDRDLCIGCGSCEEMCPEVFKIGEDGLSRVLTEEPGPELYGSIRDAADMCPVEAISIEE